ncbi:hypothetical protein ACER0A_010750 [Haloimpatiens sp. FM7315]|uniref:hypothetical protein n=1 Tax=Haloimpatiens sp. FM7315 TaxID=3298609 RepID=UPI0035A363EF
MNGILKNIISFIYLLIILSLFFVLGYILGISKTAIISSYITTIIFISCGYIVSIRKKLKYGKVSTPIIKGEQLAYIKSEIDRNIKTMLPYNKRKKDKVLKLRSIKNKLENEIPLDEDDIKELNSLV